jgi:hypothetical protein
MRYKEFAEEAAPADDLIQTQQTPAAGPSLLQRLLRTKSDSVEKEWVSRLPLGQHINDGMESDVFEHSQDPAMVVKVERKPTQPASNGYYQYVRAIQPLMSSNPYLPRIYIADSLKTRPGTRFAYTMERLYDAGNAVPHVHENMFISFVNRTFVDPPEMPTNRGSYGIWATLTKELAGIAKSRNYSNLRDSKLSQALQLIGKLNRSMDLHSGNFMIRYTSVGPQLVITDPVV